MDSISLNFSFNLCKNPSAYSKINTVYKKQKKTAIITKKKTDGKEKEKEKRKEKQVLPDLNSGPSARQVYHYY